jgi:hypothetical protein
MNVSHQSQLTALDVYESEEATHQTNLAAECAEKASRARIHQGSRAVWPGVHTVWQPSAHWQAVQCAAVSRRAGLASRELRPR